MPRVNGPTGLSTLGLRSLSIGVRWCVLVAVAFGLGLPAQLQAACDPAQCVREAQHQSSEAGGSSEEPHTDGDCSSPFHMCHCCAHVQVVPQRPVHRIGASRLAGLQPADSSASGALAGFRARLDRPPSA